MSDAEADADGPGGASVARRLTAAVGIAAVGVFAVTRAFAYASVPLVPAVGVSVAPEMSQPRAFLARLLALDGFDSGERTTVAALARAALLRDATSAPAVVALALAESDAGREAQAARLFNYAQKLTRRDLATNLYAIESAVARNDIPAALKYYDLALRTNKEAPQLLFPVLAGAIGDAPIRRELLRTLRRRPAWGGLFASYLANTGPDFAASARLIAGLEASGITPPAGVAPVLMRNLLARGDARTAWQLYVTAHPAAVNTLIRNPLMRPTADDPTPFDWTFEPVDGLDAGLEAIGTGGALRFSAAPDTSGRLVQQVLVLSPGRYRLAGTASAVAVGRNSELRWTLRCSGARVLASSPVATGDRARFGADLTVPAGCAHQVLELTVRVSADDPEVIGAIDRVTLVSAQG